MMFSLWTAEQVR